MSIVTNCVFLIKNYGSLQNYKKLCKNYFKVRQVSQIRALLQTASYSRHLFSVTISTRYCAVPYAIWQKFYEFLIFYELFHEVFGESDNSKIWETSKTFVNILRGFCEILSLLWADKNIKGRDVNKMATFQNKVHDQNIFQLHPESTFYCLTFRSIKTSNHVVLLKMRIRIN